MSSEGVTLISRAVLVAVLIIATALVRVLVGPSRRRGLYMGIGTLGGMSVGVAIASLMSHWIITDVSVICACLGIFAGWGVDPQMKGRRRMFKKGLKAAKAIMNKPRPNASITYSGQCRRTGGWVEGAG